MASPTIEWEGEEMQEKENLWELIQTFDLQLISFKKTITTILDKLHIYVSRFMQVCKLAYLSIIT